MQLIGGDLPPRHFISVCRYEGERFFELIRSALDEGALELEAADCPGALLFCYDEELIALRPGLIYHRLRAWKPKACNGLSLPSVRQSLSTFGLLRCVLQRRVGGRQQTLWIADQANLFTRQPRFQDRYVLHEMNREPRVHQIVPVWSSEREIA